MGTKKSDCVAMFPESIEKVQKSMPKETELDKVVSFFKVLADDTRVIEFDGFSTETSKFKGNIEYMSIYGFIE